MKFLKTLPLLSVLFSSIVVAGEKKEEPGSAPTPTASGQKTHRTLAERAKHFEAPPPVGHPTQSLVGVPGEGRSNVRGRGSKATAWENRATQLPVEPKKQAPAVGTLPKTNLNINLGAFVPGARPPARPVKKVEDTEAAVEAQPGQFDNSETPLVQPEGAEHFSTVDPQTEESAHKSVADIRRFAQINPLAMVPGAMPPKKQDVSESTRQLLTNDMAKSKPRKPSSNNRPTTSKIVVPNSRPETSSVVAPVVHSLAPLDDVVKSLECVPTTADSSPNMGGGHGMFLEGPGIDDSGEDLFAPKPTPAPSSAVMSRMADDADLQNPEDVDDLFGTPAPKPAALPLSPAAMSRMADDADLQNPEDEDDIFAPKPIVPAPVSSLNNVALLECVPTTLSPYEAYMQAYANLQDTSKTGHEFNTLYEQYKIAFNAYNDSLQAKS